MTRTIQGLREGIDAIDSVDKGKVPSLGQSDYGPPSKSMCGSKIAFEQLELDYATCQNDDQSLFQRVACSYGYSVQNVAES